MRLIKDEPPEGARGGGYGRTRIDIVPMIKALQADAGEWYRYPRDYSGYPNQMKKRFSDEGVATMVRNLKNDNGDVIGHRLWLMWPKDNGSGDVTPTA